jgi:hypothetical protein
MTGPVYPSKIKENNVLQTNLLRTGLQEVANDNSGQVYNSIVGNKIHGLSSIICIQNNCLPIKSCNVVIEVDRNNVVTNCYFFPALSSKKWSCINFLQSFKKRFILLVVDYSSEYVSLETKDEVSSLSELIERWGSDVVDIVFFSREDYYSLKVHGEIL